MFNGDIERGSPRYSEFDDDLTRRKFIKNVYVILAIQLLITLGLVAIFITSDAFYEYVEENPYILLVAIGLQIVTVLILACCTGARRTAPMNYICLVIFTIAQSFLLGIIGSIYDPKSIILALALTALICIVLSIYAMQTKVDFTWIGGFLFVCLIIGLIFGILMIFFYSHILMMIYCSLGVLLYSMFLIFDTQLMVRGNHAYAIRSDDYVFGALNLYIDIVQIFLCLLHLVGTDN
ncbi:protein lifeguard 2-like [Haematobia irritans]|uniref:protein lifeguard 2-like n=1 Tax=Haematobia irritans TaxID=7368 RepID=UPI003F506173